MKISKLRSVCKSCVGRLDMNINVIGLWRVSFISNRRCSYMVHRASLQLYSYLGSVERCVPCKVLSSVQEAQSQT